MSEQVEMTVIECGFCEWPMLDEEATFCEWCLTPCCDDCHEGNGTCPTCEAGPSYRPGVPDGW